MGTGTLLEHPLLALARTRPVVFDGAMGTEIQRRAPSPQDFDGSDGLNEILVRTRPDLVADIHRAYFAAGADAVETNSFGACAIVLREHGREHEARDLSREAARLAREVADDFATPARPRFVSGSVGPGTRLPTLGQIPVAEMFEAFLQQILGLLEGGVDLLQIETCQDPLQARIAVRAAVAAMAQAGRRVPVFVQGTFEPNGRMLLGTDVAAFVTSLATLPGVSALGVNCSTGPDAMVPVVRDLARLSPLPLSVLPNAGLPVNEGGRLVYRLGPDEFAAQMAEFVRDHGVSFVGGCCGTTPDHVAALAAAVRDLVPGARTVVPVPAASSLFASVALVQEPRPLIVGERTNANGSKEFRDRLGAGDVEGMVAVARSQAGEGAHLLDACVAYVGRDERSDLANFVARLREVAEPGLMVDSTDPEAIEAALEAWPGRAVVNSVNFEDGGERLDRIAAIARSHGAAIVALTIDEAGMAMTVDRKLEIGRRLIDRLVNVHGFAPGDILLDVLTFTLGSGDSTLRDAAARTIEAVARVKRELPGVLTSLGVSNVSYGLKPPARRVLNAVFLHHCVAAGLDAAILNAGRIVPLADLPADLRQGVEDLVFDRHDRGDPLQAFLDRFETATAEEAAGAVVEIPPDERLHRMVVRGERSGLEAVVDAALGIRAPLSLINEVLLEAMRVVGDRFGKGEMPLPFVLRSAEVVKAAVARVEPHLDRTGGAPRGTLVLATVSGDVHDIGKNLVDVLLSNHGYRIVNLGIQQPLQNMLDAAEREHADAIGMSGLLVKSTMVMRDNLVEMARRGLTIPVLLGGAALNRRWVDEELAPLYPGRVAYCADAFDGLRVMESLHEAPAPAPEPRRRAAPAASGPVVREPVEPVDPPAAEFLGLRVERAMPLDEIARLLNRTSLFRGQWQFKRGKRSQEEWERFAATQLEPMFQDRLRRWTGEGALVPQAVWGLFPANSEGEQVVVFDPDGAREVARFTFPRQDRAPGRCLSDYVLPLSTGRRDVLGVQVATVGPAASRAEAALFQAGDFTEYLYLHGISVELAEATAEWVHRRVRQALGIAAADAPDPEGIRLGRYRGCRVSFGYPACPDLEQQRPLLDLLRAGDVGVTLTANLQMVPEQTTSAIVFHHPEARPF